MALSGPLDAPDTRVALDCPAWNVGGHALANVALTLESAPLRWRQVLLGTQGPMVANSGSDSSPELAVNVQATASVDGFAQRLGTTIFARQAKEAGSTAVLVGLRDLQGDVLGLAASGQVTAALPMPLIVAGMPRVDGKVDVRVADWKALSALVPGAQLEG